MPNIESPGVQVFNVCSAMLEGQTPYLDGCFELVALREAVGAYENDPDFFAFVAVLPRIRDTEVDFGDSLVLLRASPSKKAVLDELETWVKEHTLTHCASLVQRYQSAV